MVQPGMSSEMFDIERLHVDHAHAILDMHFITSDCGTGPLTLVHRGNPTMFNNSSQLCNVVLSEIGNSMMYQCSINRVRYDGGFSFPALTFQHFYICFQGWKITHVTYTNRLSLAMWTTRYCGPDW